MRERSLTPGDVASAIQKLNVEVTSGQLGMPPAPAGQDFQLTVNIAGALSKAEEFEAVIVKSDAQGGGQISRIRDIGRVELGAQTYSQFFSYDQRPAAGVAIFSYPAPTHSARRRGWKRPWIRCRRTFRGIEYAIPFDTTLFIRASVDEVYTTLLQAGALVLLVIVIFLQDWRAILVPATTVPVTIIGAFRRHGRTGFQHQPPDPVRGWCSPSVSWSTTPSIVVEGTTQHLERGQNAKEAAGNAMRQLFGPIVGITLVLMSVFLPAAFLPGITGQMYRQFALVIAATALISAITPSAETGPVRPLAAHPG